MPHIRLSSWKMSSRYKGESWRISSLVSYLLLLWSGPSVGEGWDSGCAVETLCHLWRWEGGTVRYNQQGDVWKQRRAQFEDGWKGGLAFFLLTQIINPARLAAEFRGKQDRKQSFICHNPFGKFSTSCLLGAYLLWHSFNDRSWDIDLSTITLSKCRTRPYSQVSA